MGGNNGISAVEIVSNTSPNTLPATTAVSIDSGATMDLNGSTQQVASLNDYVSGSQGTVTNSASNTTSPLTLAPSGGGSSTFSGVIQNGNGTVRVIMNGTGTQVLAGVNTYTGGTTITSGTLRVASTGALGPGNVSIGSGGMLTLQNAQTVAAFTSAGVLNVSGKLNVTAGATLQDGANESFSLGTPNGTTNPADAFIAVSGPTNSLTVNGTNTISFSNPNVGTYDLISYTGSTASNNFVLDTNSIANYAGLTFQLINGSGQIDLLVSTPPIIWSGVNGSNGSAAWDYNTANWVTANGTAVNYADPNGVVSFGDFYPNGQTVVNSNVVIRPGGVTPLVVTLNASGFANNGVDYTFSDADGVNGIGGSASIILNAGPAGNETVTFLSPNSFTGAVSINAGYLNVENSAALGNSSGVSVASGAVLQLQSPAPDGSVPVVAGTGVPLSITGNGDGFGALQNVLGNNTYAGLITGSGTISSNDPSGSLTLTGGLNPQGNTLTITGVGPVNINTVGVSGSAGTIEYNDSNGSSTLTLNAANSFTGLTQIDGAATFVVSNTGSLAGSLTYNSSSTSTINGTLNGASAVLTATNGTLILNGANTYGGGTTLSGGTVRVAVSSSPSSGTLASGALGAGPVALNSGALQDNGSAVILGNAMSLNGSVTFSSSGSGSLTLDGTGLSTPATFNIAGNSSLTVNNTTTINDVVSGSSSLAIGGTGSLILGSANPYSGAMTINSGVVQLNNTNSLQNSVVTLNAPGGLTFNTTVNGSVALGGLSGSAPLMMTDLGSNPVALTLGNSNSVGSSAGNYSGNVTSATTLTKVGTNTQTLSGSNSFSGVTVNSGTLSVIGNTALGNGPVTLTGGTLRFAQSVASIGVHFGTDNTAYILAPSDFAGVPGFVMSNWNNAPGGTGNTSNVSSGSNTGSLVNNSGTVTSALVSWTEGGGTFTSGNSSTPDNRLMGSFPNFEGASNVATFTNIPFASYEVVAYVGAEGGANGRSATLTIGGAPTYSFQTDTFAGSNPYNYIPITNTTSGTYPPGNYAVANGLSGSSLTVTETSIGDNTGLMGVEIIDMSATNVATYTNNVLLNGGANSTIDVAPNQPSGGFDGALQVGSGSNTTLNVTAANAIPGQPFGLTLGSVSLNGNVNFNVANNTNGGGNASGTLTLGALNDNGTPRTITLSGPVPVTLNTPVASLGLGTVVNINNGTLNSNTTGAIGSTATVNINNAGKFAVGASQTISALNGISLVANVGLGSGQALTVGSTDNLSSSFGGSINGSGSLIKSGTGTLTLIGASTFQGGTTINTGALAIGNSTALGTGVVNLAGGALQFIPVQPTGSIGVHFGTDQTAYVLPPATSAGIVPMINWNNAPGQNGSTSNLTSAINGNLVDNSGAVVSGAAIAWTSGGSTYSQGGLTSTGDNILMGSFTNIGNTTVNVTGIPYSSYEVIAYVGNEGGTANGRSANINIGGTTYYYSTDTNDYVTPFTYIPITNTSSGSNPGGNYAIFTGQTSSSFTATLNQAGNSGLDGIEIVNTGVPVASESLANSISVSQDSSIQLNGTAIDSAGPLSIGNNTLSISGTSTNAGTDPYTLTLGATTLTGNPTFNVNNNGSGTGTLVLGAAKRRRNGSNDNARRNGRRDAGRSGQQSRRRHRRQHRWRHTKSQRPRRFGHHGHGQCRRDFVPRR